MGFMSPPLRKPRPLFFHIFSLESRAKSAYTVCDFETAGPIRHFLTKKEVHIIMVHTEFIALRLHGGAALSAGAARLLVNYALRRRGREGWPLASVEVFPGAGGGSGETLLLARPVRFEVRLADYVLPLLGKYFTD